MLTGKGFATIGDFVHHINKTSKHEFDDIKCQISRIESVCDEVLDLTNGLAYQRTRSEEFQKKLE